MLDPHDPSFENYWFSLRHAPRLWSTALALLLALAAWGGARAAGPDGTAWPFGDRSPAVQVHDDAETIGLFNDRSGVLLRKRDAALLGIWSADDGRSAVNVDARGHVRTPLWEIQLLPSGASNAVAASQATATNIVWRANGDDTLRELTGTLRDVPCGPVRCALTLRVALARGDAALRWRLDAAPADAAASAWEIAFPQVFVTAFDDAPKANHLLAPYRRGTVGPYGPGVPRARSELPYPGPAAKFQFMAAYGTVSERGFYFAAEDGDGHTKTLTRMNEPDRNGIVLGWRHFPADRAAPGTAFRMPYAIVTQPYRGDWWDACQIYRAWWVKQGWASRGPLASRQDLPKWLTHTPIVVRLSTTKPARTVANNLRAAFALSDALDNRPFYGVWYGPFGVPNQEGLGDSGNGHRLPPQPGVTDALQQLRARGIRVQAYQQSVIYQTTFPGYATEKEAADGAVSRGADNTPHYYGPAAKGDYAMCRATEWWQRRMIDMAEHATRLGFAGVYLDSFGKGASDCLAANHGHPRGGGNTVIDGQLRMARRIREAVRAIDAESILAGEAPIEAFREALDVYLFAVNRYAGYVPANRAIWGDYGLGHGRVVRAMKAGPTVIAELATLFLEGAIPGRFYCEGGSHEILQPGHEAELDFLKRSIVYTEQAIDHLRFGQFLRPLKLEPEPPSVTFAESAENNTVTIPGVLTAALRSHRDGSVALALVNITESAQTTAFTVDPALRAGDSAARPEAVLSRMGPDGKQTLKSRGAKAWREILTLAPHDIAVFVLN